MPNARDFKQPQPKEQDSSRLMTSVKADDTSIKVHTLGCRLNTFESEVMRTHARDQGLEDTIIINTCAVTNEAERQSRQTVRRAVKNNPNSRVIVTGCSAQLNPDVYAKIDGVERVLGNHEKMKAESFSDVAPERVRVNNIFEVSETANHLISGFENHVRSFVQIQNGCNHRCTFCSIPFGRGNNRSVPVEDIIKQIEMLLENDVQEVVLTGVDITDYGSSLEGEPKLGDLVQEILDACPSLMRLRLSSIDPVEVDAKLMHLLKTEDRIMPHLHISLQAGDDMVLKRMKRRHLCQDVREFCQEVQKARPDVVFGGDIIAGFPTESDEMFENTYRFLQELELAYLHVFPYSARAGTPAARMPQVEKKIIKERAEKLRQLGRVQKAASFQKLLGQSVNVLIEEKGRGHSECFADVQLMDSDNQILSDDSLTGRVVNANVFEATDRLVFARIMTA